MGARALIDCRQMHPIANTNRNPREDEEVLRDMP